MLPTPKSFPVGGQPLLPFPKGPGKGKNLAVVGGASAQIIGRNACKELWTKEELKKHMLSPKLK